jgi:hypothetical protein
VPRIPVNVTGPTAAFSGCRIMLGIFVTALAINVCSAPSLPCTSNGVSLAPNSDAPGASDAKLFQNNVSAAAVIRPSPCRISSARYSMMRVSIEPPFNFTGLNFSRSEIENSFPPGSCTTRAPLARPLESNLLSLLP